MGELHDPQVALILLRHCASFGKLVYSLRVVPHHKHTAALENFDNAVRDCVESFLSCSITDSEWSLANLSTKMGGLGLQSVEKHSSAAFLASRIACRELCSRLDTKYVWDITTPSSDCYKALNDYNAKVDQSSILQTTGESIPRQQTLSQAIDSRVLATLKERSKHNTYFLAHLNLTTTSGAGSWLHTFPSRALGTHVDPILYKTMVQRWLRIPVFQSEHHCPFCDEVVGRFGDHCLTCSVGGDRTKRHNLICNKVYHFSLSAGLNPELERTGLLQPRPLLGSAQESGAERDNNAERRPADVYIPRWRRGTPAAFDLAVTSGLRRCVVKDSAKDGTHSVKLYEAKKRTYLDTETLCQDEGIQFIPLICEANGGGWGPAAQVVWKELAKQKSSMTGESQSITTSHLLQSLSLILHKENARAILRRSPHNSFGRNDINTGILAASAAFESIQDL